MRDSINAADCVAKSRRRVPYLVRLRRGYAFRRRYPLDIRPFVDHDFFFKRLEAVDFEQAKREVHEARGGSVCLNTIRAEISGSAAV
ncbi:MAG: hypothetical protein AB1761_17030 [Pseudomonadota bacterium]